MIVHGIPERTFWEEDCTFVLGVAVDKAAYDGWMGYVREHLAEKARKK